MNVLSAATSAIKSCSGTCSTILVYLLVFLMLPIDSLLKVNVQGQVKSALGQLLNNVVGQVVVVALFYLIWCTKDVMLLLLYVCLLKKLGLF